MGRIQAEGPFQAQLKEFPLLCVRSPSVAIYDHVNVRSFFGCLEHGFARQQPFVVLHDVREIPHVDEARRQEFLVLLAEHREKIARHTGAYAAIVSSPFERGLVTAFVWISKLPFPVRIFTSEPEARAWLWARHGDFVRRQREA